MPYFLHVFPVLYDSFLNRIVEIENSSFFESFNSYKTFLNIKETFASIPTMISGSLGLPTIEGKYVLGASSPAIPALIIPEPLSMTTAGA